MQIDGRAFARPFSGLVQEKEIPVRRETHDAGGVEPGELVLSGRPWGDGEDSALKLGHEKKQPSVFRDVLHSN